MKKLLISSIVIFSFFSSVSQHGVKVATWNLEHLGEGGRGGFGACGSNFSNRSVPALEGIASLIKRLNLDIVAIQEVAVTVENDGSSSNKELDAIESHLGRDWESYIARKHFAIGPYKTGVGKEQVAFLYNTKTVRLDTIFEMVYPAIRMQSSDIHDRHPLVGKFTILQNGTPKNDFVLVNLHLASTQTKKENKGAGMAMIYSDVLKILTSPSKIWEEEDGKNKLEDDIVFLGDFNHNPYKEQSPHEDGLHSLLTNSNGTADARFVNLVREDMDFTRFNFGFSSLIDHIYVSEGMQEHLQYPQAAIFIPFNDRDCNKYAEWRKNFSDHLPVYFKILTK